MTLKNPLIGRRVLNVHRQLCDACEESRLAYHGTVLDVEEGPNPVIWVQFDGLEFKSAQSPQDLAFTDTWPAPESRRILHKREEVALLTGFRLDWAVGMAKELLLRFTEDRRVLLANSESFFAVGCTWEFCPTTDGSQAWKLLKENRMDINFVDEMGSTGCKWEAMLADLCGGDTPEEAVCRAFVTSKLGHFVYLPPYLYE